MIGAPPAGGGIQIPGRPGVRRGRLCDHAAQVPAVQADRFGSASDSIHRQSVGHSCYAAETGTHSANCAVGVVALSTCPLLCLTSA